MCNLQLEHGEAEVFRKNIMRTGLESMIILEYIS